MKWLSLLTLLVLGGTLSAQTLIFEENFDADFGQFTFDDRLLFVPDGSGAGNVTTWGLRNRIQSRSRGGALLFQGTAEQVELTTQFDLPVVTTGPGELYLDFFTYFSSNGGTATVFVESLTGRILDQFELTDPRQQETRAGAYYWFNLSESTRGEQAIVLRFELNGNFEFLLLDDVRLQRERPVRPTFPIRVGEELEAIGQPFVVDTLGTPLVPFQLVWQFPVGAARADIDKIRTFYQAERVEDCVCGRLELWQTTGGVFFDPKTGEPLGDATEIYERTKPGGGNLEPDGVDYNSLHADSIGGVPVRPIVPLTPADLINIPVASTQATRIAILDTGMDYQHPGIRPFVFRNDDELNGNTDDDANCYPDDPLGWNFINDNNNPLDDNGHGTHVAGIVAQNLPDCDGCDFEILSYKIQDSYGVGTLFDASCAILQAAVNDSVDVINASWGYFGSPASILRNAIDTAANYGALFVTAAGNDSLFLDPNPQWPAGYNLANIVSVGASEAGDDGNLIVSDFSNYSSTLVDILAEGRNVSSAAPGGGTTVKSGTSMSTPAVVAAAATEICRSGESFQAAIDHLYTDAFKTPFTGLVRDGNDLRADRSCPTGTDDPDSLEVGFTVFPNPAAVTTYVTVDGDLNDGRILVVNPLGQTVRRTRVMDFRAGVPVALGLCDLAPGIYTVVLTRGNRLRARRLLIP